MLLFERPVLSSSLLKRYSLEENWAITFIQEKHNRMSNMDLRKIIDYILDRQDNYIIEYCVHYTSKI